MKEETKAQIILHRDDLDIYRSAKDQAAAWGYEIDPYRSLTYSFQMGTS